MNCKRLLFAVILVCITALAAVGCGQAEQPAPATEPTQATTNASTSLPPSDNGSRPLPPTDNGTMPIPGQGGFYGERPSVPMMDLAAAASKLGVTEQQLREALGDQTQGPTDMAATAAKLGVSEDSLREALGLSDNGTPPGAPSQGGFPPDGTVPSGQAKQTK